MNSIPTDRGSTKIVFDLTSNTRITGDKNFAYRCSLESIIHPLS